MKNTFPNIGREEPLAKTMWCWAGIKSEKGDNIPYICLLAAESMTQDGVELATHATLSESTNVAVEEGSVVHRHWTSSLSWLASASWESEPKGICPKEVEVDRRELWDELARMMSLWEMPWCIGGDFNVRSSISKWEIKCFRLFCNNGGVGGPSAWRWSVYLAE
jgi:hypothetical protein